MLAEKRKISFNATPENHKFLMGMKRLGYSITVVLNAALYAYFKIESMEKRLSIMKASRDQFLKSKKHLK